MPNVGPLLPDCRLLIVGTHSTRLGAQDLITSHLSPPTSCRPPGLIQNISGAAYSSSRPLSRTATLVSDSQTVTAHDSPGGQWTGTMTTHVAIHVAD